MAKPRSPRGRARLTVERLASEYPDAPCPLAHESAFQLLVATILSAQSTDAMVNRVTPALFAAYPDAAALAAANVDDVERLIQPTGFYRAKTKSIMGMAAGVSERFRGVVPGTMKELVTLPGVGRKTANVILGHWFGKPGIPVDTHVQRLSKLLGLSTNTDPEKIEADLSALWPRAAWTDTSIRLIYHGRAVCIARRPRCPECVLNDFCPSASTASTAPCRPG